MGYSDLLIGFSPLRIISEILRINVFTSLVLFVSFLSVLAFIGIVKYIKIFQNQQLNNIQLLLISVACFGSGFSLSASTHPQLFMIYFYPWILYFFERSKTSRKNSLFLGLLLGIILTTSIYIFIFSFISIAFLYLLQIKNFKNIFTINILLLISGICLTGFYAFYIYFRTYLMVGPRNREELVGNLPPIFNVFNYGESNLMWGGLVKAFAPFFGNGAGNHEYALAVTPILSLTCFICLLIFRNKSQSLVLFILGIFLILLTVEFQGLSLWTIFSHIPGFDVIRVIGRVQLISHFLICIALALLIVEINGLSKSRYLLVFGLVGLIFMENVSSGLNAQVNLKSQKTLVDLGKNSPNGCDSFFAISSDFDRPNYAHQVDSMIVSMGAKIPSLNGYSGNQPKNWEVNNIQFPDYADRIKNWIKEKNLTESICLVDLDKKTWGKFKY